MLRNTDLQASPLLALWLKLGYTLYKHTIYEVNFVEARIAKWGNSCGIRLPNSIVKALKMKEGTTVDIRMEKSHIVVSKSKSYKLKDLLSKITAQNRHKEIATGPSVGDEIW